eukprot:COSAG02_NODE_6106_length_3793_cov_2.481244_2_plen_60_part_00
MGLPERSTTRQAHRSVCASAHVFLNTCFLFFLVFPKAQDDFWSRHTSWTRQIYLQIARP